MTNSHPSCQPKKATSNERLLRITGIVAIIVAALLVLIKAIAWQNTGSVTLLGTLLDSILDVVISSFNFWMILQALRPPDHKHRFGHGKAEALGGLFQAIIIGASALFLVSEAIQFIREPHLPEDVGLGISIMLLSSALVLALVLLQRYTIKRTGSLVVTGDALHGASDVIINLGGILALLCSSYLAAPLIDPVIALLLAAFLLRGAWQIGARATGQLMDEELSESHRKAICDIALQHQEVRDIHDLRTRSSGSDCFIQLHLELNGNIDLKRAHQIADEVEEAIKQRYPQAEVLIHQDPYGEETIDRFFRS